MKTRSEIYNKEAAEILRVVTTYKTLEEQQIFALFPNKQDAVKNLLTYFVKQGRLYFNSETKRYSIDEKCDENPDCTLIHAFWILLDFIDKVTYHTADDYPIKISFFTDGELYEIIHLSFEKEQLTLHILSETAKNGSRRIILMDSAELIKDFGIANTSCYCTVDTNGTVQYYKLE